MINPEKLQAVTKIVTHKNCADGIASAMILRQALPGAEVLFIGYDDERAKLAAEPGLLFCDMTPPAERVEEFLAAESIVLDHHATQRSITERFVEAGLGYYADNSKGEHRAFSGASLASLFSLRATTWFSHLVGIYDTWDRDSPHWEDACAVTEALHFFGADHFLRPGAKATVNDFEMDVGRLLYERKLKRAEETFSSHVLLWPCDAENWPLFYSDDTNEATSSIAFFNDDQYDRLVNDVGEYVRVRAAGSIVLVVGYRVVTERGADDASKLFYKYSLRRGNAGDVDCGKLAATLFLGGGGHPGAGAGRLPCPLTHPSDYDAILEGDPVGAFLFRLSTERSGHSISGDSQ